MLSWMSELWATFASKLTSVLPLSPFRQLIRTWHPAEGVAFLNWLVPIPEIIELLSAWIAAYALYLLYRAILRWLKIVS